LREERRFALEQRPWLTLQIADVSRFAWHPSHLESNANVGESLGFVVVPNAVMAPPVAVSLASIAGRIDPDGSVGRPKLPV
jgi:hypothetical protein